MHDHASFNRAYRVVFNAALGAMVAVPETARSHGGSTTRSIAASAGLLLALAGPGAWAQTVAPNALPQDGKVAAGQVNIPSATGNHLRIEQASERAIVNWKGFDVGAEASVRIVQPASAVILNRVQSGPGSQILGRLDADAKVYLVNPAGILFGPNSQVNVGGLTASTLGIRDDDFLNGRDRFTADGVAGSVVNQGTITVGAGGRVALIGTRVENAGQILAPNGQVVLAAGRQATLAIGANGHLQVEVDAAQVGTLVANGGLIQADGGQVILTAKGAGALASSVVSNTGTLQARTVDGASGRILLLADMATGRVEAGGTLDASAPNGGDGGFIETSAARVEIAPDLKVTTAAAHGKTGKWLIDPQDYTIAASGGDITGTQLSTFLATTDVEIESSSGGTAGNGDIHVNDAVSWNANTLTLTAARDININAVMTAGGTSALALDTGTTNGGDTGVPAGTVKVGLGPTGFRGRIDFPGRSGTGILTINGVGYTVLDALGSEGSTTGADLQGMNGALGGHYALGSNIDASASSTWASGAGFAPIGSGPSFTGTFEGLGHVISNLTINRDAEDSVGLFASTSGTIRNVGLVGGAITGPLGSSFKQTGALAGNNEGTIVNAYSTAVVTGGYNVGGLVGRSRGGSITGSYSSGQVNGQYTAGGLVGWNQSTIRSSYATGNVAVTIAEAGGLVGYNDSRFVPESASIIDSYYAGGTVFAPGAAGGLVGYNGGTILRSHATGTVTGESNTGGLVGSGCGCGEIIDSYAAATVRGELVPNGWRVQYTGGLAGSNFGTIRNSYATGSVEGGDNVGGLVGYASSGSISDSYSTGSVSGNDFVGGLTGDNSGVIERSYASGPVTGNWAVGGLTGFNASSITDSYATGTVTANQSVGGLVGYAYSGASISTSYATGLVSGGSSVGGLVGQRDDPGATFADSFWDTQTTGQLTSEGGTGRTSAEMRQAATFTGAGWNLAATGGTGETWRIYEGNTAPLLRKLLTPLTPVTRFDGSATPVDNPGAYDLPAGTDMSKVLGFLGSSPILTLASSGTAGNYLANVPVAGLYSNQGGYDIASTATRTIATPGSAAGDVRLDNPLTWSAGFVNITAANDIDLNGQAITSTMAGLGTLNFQAGGQIRNAGSVAVDRFELLGGTWNQVAGTLPSIAVRDFRLTGGTFIRALGGDGSVATPYQIADMFGLQGIGSAGMGNQSYVLANDIDASGTATWQFNAGFVPIASFSGSLDGQGHAIDGLVINLVSANPVGLFSVMSGDVNNLRITGGSVNGTVEVGALAGRSTGTISNVSSSATVRGVQRVGGLVGQADAGSITDSHATATVDAISNVAGGLVGLNNAAIEDSDASGVVTVRSYTGGGLVGFAGADSTITGSHATGAVNATTSTPHLGLGGLVGENYGAITGSYATGNVTASAPGTVGVGGLVGINATTIVAGTPAVGAISGSYATGTVQGGQATGGLVGYQDGSVSDSYATGAVVGTDYVGGLAGYIHTDSTTATSYSSGSVAGATFVGGLVGARASTAALSGSFWNVETSGQATSAGTGATGLTTAQMQSLATFAGAGWDISGTGGTNDAWRIYDGHTAPLLRSFLTPLALVPAYDGSGTPLAHAGAVVVPTGADTSKIFGTAAAGTVLTLSSSGVAGSYRATADATVSGLYSNQVGYDILPDATRLVSTPGSAAGDVRLDNPITWTSDTVNITAANNVDLNGQALASTNGTLNFNVGSQVVNAGTVAVNLFDLQGGTWNQVAASLPSFSATDFRLGGGTFLRALAGDGAGTPYQLADVYGLQGMGSTGMGGRNFVLANDIAAAGTSGWNAGAGFLPVAAFTGSLDGQGHAISGLAINRGGTQGVGLFSVLDGSVSNLEIAGGSVHGADETGALAGRNLGTVTNVSSSADVQGAWYVGGLVGRNDARIEDSDANGLVTATSVVGGLVGENGAGALISGSHATGAVSAVYDTVGGLAGYNIGGSITGSYAIGDVQAGTGTAGGLVGVHETGTISGSYATGTVHGPQNAGGLVGFLFAGIDNSYATGAVDGGNVGGLVGHAYLGGSITNSYATGPVNGTNAGGLVGAHFATSIFNSFWNVETTGQATSAGTGATGITTAQMQSLATFAGAGWDISDAGGTTDVWRIYDGHTAPLLRSFLTPLALVPAYDGSGAPLANAGAVVVPTGADVNKIFGTPTSGGVLTLSSSGVANNYRASVNANVTGMYSNQSGYDLLPDATRLISTPGSAAGDVRLDNPITWANGTVSITAGNNVDLNGQALASASGSLTFDVGNRILDAGDVAVNLFNLQGGTWDQVTGALPSFGATDFRLGGGTFLRALAGDGSAAAPYRLADIYGVQGMGSTGMLDKSYVLANDIDASGTASWNAAAGFVPVGNTSSRFTGSFDGEGHTISSLAIARPLEDYVGLFGFVTGSIANVGLLGGSVIGGAHQVGGLAGASDGTIANAWNTGTVASASPMPGIAFGMYVGGLVGSLGPAGAVTDSYATGAVDGRWYVGGLVGASEGAISNSHASGAVNGRRAVGGLVGAILEPSSGPSSITNSHATGAVTAGNVAGGLVGLSWGTITGSHATGNVTTTGGATELHATCTLSTHHCAGGLVGDSHGTISGSYATGDVTGLGRYVGGLVGRVTASPGAGGVVGSYATGNVSGGSEVGGLAGFAEVAISGSHYAGTVTGYLSVGGLVGEGWSSVSDSYATGLVTGSGGIGMGGLVGLLLDASIERSYADVSVTGGIAVGGLVGDMGLASTIVDSYATGSVDASMDIAGGLVGLLTGSSITRSYATGRVTGPGFQGGLVGRVDSGGTIVDSFWDTTTTNQSTSAGGGTGVDTAAMRQLATFAGWDISASGGTGDVWRIYEGNTAPLLRGFLTPLTLTPAYDGSGTPVANAGAYSVPGSADSSRIFGMAGNTLVLSSSGAAGNYVASVPVDGLYSNQFGYDIMPATRTIATPGSAVGDVRLDNPVTWTNGTVNVTAANDVDLNNQAFSSPSGTLQFNAGNQIRNAGAVAVNLFDLQGGTWNQVGSALPAFSASDFRISGGTFVRALGGDGSSATPYRLTDVFGLQGMDSDGMVDKHFVLANDIAAAGTSGWNGGAGFLPVFEFDGSLDGQGHAITGLVIERPTEDLVGLFSIVNGEVGNLALVGGSVRGRDVVGALAGISGGEITNVSSSAAVQGQSVVGGLVGAADAGEIIGSSASGSVMALAVGGGLVGVNNSEISNSDATGAVTVTQIFAGGLAGVNDLDGRIIGSHATGAVNGVASVGGLVGDNAGSIEGSYSIGSVQGESGVGGLVGSNCACRPPVSGLPDSGSISGSYASGNVTGVDGVGGLVGHNAGNVSNSYATGAVTASESVGGLVGYADIASGISNSYASGMVTGLTDVGGLVGLRADATATVSNSFWDVQTTLQSGSDGGSGLTTAQMQAQATFTGWDFATTWVQYEGHTAPLLRSFLTALTVTANDATKTYDGQAYDGSAGVRYSFAPDMTKLLGTTSYTSGVNAGTHAIAPAGLYSHQQGYLVTFASGTLTVDPKALAVSGMTGRDKVYDGNDTAQFDGGTLVGLVGSETLNFSAQGFFADGKNAGTDKAVTVSGITLADGTGLASNYAVSNPTGLTADITRRSLTVGATGIDKTYDGTRDADVNLSDDRVLGDALTFQSTARFDTRNAGTGKTVNVTGIAITGGADAGNYELSGDTANTVANIDRRALNVGATGVDKEYNRSTVATVTITDDRIAGDQLTYSATAHFDNWNVGTGKPIDVTAIALSGGADAGNYVVGNTTATTTASITPRPLNVTASADDKVYNGLRDAAVTLADDRIVGDVFAVTRVSAEFDDKNVGNGKRVSVQGISFSGADGANYALVNTSTDTTADITKRPLTVGATGVDKVYNRDTAATVTYNDDRAGADDLTFTGSASFRDWNAGTNKPVDVLGIVVSGPDAGNYDLANTTTSTTATITPRPLTVFALADNKVYDGNTAADVTLTDTRLAGDSFTVTHATATFLGANAGSNIPVTVTGLALSSGDAGNYQLTATTADTFAEISRRLLTFTANGIPKEYDGGLVGQASFTDNRVAGDVFSYDYQASFADKNVGTGKPLAVTGIGIQGGQAGNYTLAATSANTTADITPRPLNVTAFANNKTYNANRNATVGFNDDRVGGDLLTYSGSGLFDDKNAGNGKTVAISGFTWGGADAGNYTLVAAPTTATASILRRNISVFLFVPDKEYDRTTAADVLSGGDTRVAGDVLGVTYDPATFADWNAGVDKTVTITGVALTGPDAGNYSLPGSTITRLATIFPRSLVVTAAAADKQYDGDTSATVVLADNRIPGDQLAVASAAAAFNDRHAGVDKLVDVTGITLGGTDAGNYQLGNDRTSAFADITPRRLTVTATGGTKVYDQTDTAGVTLADDRLAIDSFSVVGTARFDNRNAGVGKPIAVTGITIFGANAGNYELASDTTATTGTITPRDVTVQALAGGRTYDGTTDATVGFQIGGVLPLDVLTVSGHDPVAFADRHAGIDKPLHVTGITLGGADAGNYNLTNTAASTTGSIFPRTITVSATAADKVYDGTRAADATFFHFRVAGDVFDVLGTATFADRNVGTDKVVSVSDLRLEGADAGNYRLSMLPVNTLADITPRPLNVTATGVDKVYDRSTSATVNFSDDRLAGDQFAVSATARFGDFNVGSGKTVSVTGAALSGADAGNYTVGINATTTASITPAPLLVAVESETRQSGGEPFSGAGSVRYVGLVPGDDASVLFGLPVWGGTAQGASLPGSYSLTVSGFGAANYDIRYADGTLTLVPGENVRTSGEAERQARQVMEAAAVQPAPAGLRLTIAQDFLKVD